MSEPAISIFRSCSHVVPSKCALASVFSKWSVSHEGQIAGTEICLVFGTRAHQSQRQPPKMVLCLAKSDASLDRIQLIVHFF